MINKKSTIYILIFLLLSLAFSGCLGSIETSESLPSPQEIEQNLIIAHTVQPTIVTPTIEDTVTTEAISTLIPYTTPEWYKQDLLLYEIYVRSFVDSNEDGIGDLNGIIQKFDYLKSLGVTSVWMMPIFTSPSEHGYDVSDYYQVNPQYGELADLQNLVNAAHERGIRIILDFVPSHLSNQNPIFQDAYRNPDSIYSDWFVWTNDQHTQYATFGGNESMPRFNHYNSEVVEYLTDVALYWMDLDSDGDYKDGIDGFRVDNATFPPQEFFISLRQSLKGKNPDSLLLGETWVNSPGDLVMFFENQFDSLFDFPFYSVIQGDKNTNNDSILAGYGFPALIDAIIQEEKETIPAEAILVKFLSNHDTNRIATEVAGDADREKLAAGLLAALPGPLMVYYGEEIGMLGQKGGPPSWDNYRREPMDWYADLKGQGQTTWFQPEDSFNKPNDGISVAEEEADPESVLNYYRNAIEIRSLEPALRLGDIINLKMEVSQTGPWGFTRTAGEETILLLANFASEARQVTMIDPPFPLSNTIDLLTKQSVQFEKQGENYTIDMPPATVFWIKGK
jgi:glycosidase